MGLEPFLAMTAAEITGNRILPPKIAWMACHFSPYGPGLSNLPRALPPGSLLTVDDATPMGTHDPRIILDQLCRCTGALNCAGILLDFQRSWDGRTADLVDYLSNALPCPMAVSHIYANHCSRALCIPSVPPSEPPEGWFSRWKGKELWLEISPEGEQIAITEEGSAVDPLPCPAALETDFPDSKTLCHYRQELRGDSVIFTLYRTAEDQQKLLALAENHGITTALGLYQEFHTQYKKNENRPA